MFELLVTAFYTANVNSPARYSAYIGYVYFDVLVSVAL